MNNFERPTDSYIDQPVDGKYKFDGSLVDRLAQEYTKMDVPLPEAHQQASADVSEIIGQAVTAYIEVGMTPDAAMELAESRLSDFYDGA